MADAVAQLAVVINGSSKGLQRAVKSGGAATTAAAGGMMGALAGVATAALAAGVAVAALGTIALAKFVKKSRGVFVDFEEGMIRTQAIMQKELGPSIEGGTKKFEDLETEIRNVAKASKFTAREVSDAAGVLALAGLQFDDLVTKGAIESITNFSIAAGTDVETAAGVGISAVSAFGLEIEDLTKVSDVMTNTFTSSFTDLVSLGQAMKFLGPTASAAGVSLEESAAAVGALGNAGLQGTIAGTGLRMSINKLISPTDDARRAMNRLGLDFFRLTPAGEAAKTSMMALESSLSATRLDLDSTTAAVKKLSDEMEDLSISQQKNSLQIAQIRMRASRQGRELNEQEIETINRLEMANEAMGIEERKLGIQRQEASRDQRKLTTTLADQESTYKSLNQTMSQQTTGITSLSDVVNQLSEAGATTSEILEIFSVRGGTAIMALMGQRDGFLELAEANRNATGATQDFVDITKTSTAFAMAEVRSNFEETMLVVGEFFAHIFKMEGGIGDALKRLSESVVENRDGWAALAAGVANGLIPVLEQLPEIIPQLVEGLRIVGAILRTVGFAAQIAIIKLTPLINGMVKLIEISQSMANSTNGIVRFFGGAMFGGLIGGMDAKNKTNTSVAGNAMTVSADDLLALGEGGIVTGPTIALIGEKGPEAVVPLSQGSYPNSGSEFSGNTTVMNFDSIVINGDANTSSAEVRAMIEQTMPKILKDSFKSSRGVI